MTTPAWHVPPTWALGNAPSATDFNNLLRDNLNHLATPPSCQANRTTTLSIPTATLTKINFNAADTWDTDSIHDPVTNNTRLTIPANLAGIYRFWFNIEWPAGTGGSVRSVSYYVNGVFQATISTIAGAAFATPHNNTGFELPLVATDYVEIAGYQDTGGAINIQAGAVFGCIKESL